MEQKIRYRITTSMGIWYAYTCNISTESSQISECQATRAYPTDGKYSPLALTTFCCDHIVEYLPKSLTIVVQDIIDNNVKRSA